jgi:hypothetical protein
MNAAESVQQLAAAVASLLSVSWSSCADAELLELGREVEVLRRRLDCFDHRLVAELDTRGLADRELLRSTPALLAQLFTISPGEASRRARESRELAPGVTPSGAPVPPGRPELAQAREAGAISGDHVQLVLRALDRLPGSLAPSVVAEAETVLTEYARVLPPPELAKAATRLVNTLDPDGRFTDDLDRRRRRSLTITPLGDGMHRLSGDLDPACAALAGTVLNALAAPRPSDADGPDARTATQRRHDALAQVMSLALRADELPQTAGTPATVLITLRADQLADEAGTATTSTGALLSAADALHLADQAALALLVTSDRGEPLQLYRRRRVASPSQTLALIARDRGCTFPGCTMPPEWTEKHHIRAWKDGGETNLDNLCLICDYHHDNHLRRGWTIQLRDGRPWFRPPPLKDPQQRPVRNRHFHPDVPGG